MEVELTRGEPRHRVTNLPQISFYQARTNSLVNIRFNEPSNGAILLNHRSGMCPKHLGAKFHEIDNPKHGGGCHSVLAVNGELAYLRGRSSVVSMIELSRVGSSIEQNF